MGGCSDFTAAFVSNLDSDILRADARHTLADVFTTAAVIAGWQLAARGYAWLDTIFALGVAVLVLFLAYDLFKRAVPMLVDSSARGINGGCVCRIWSPQGPPYSLALGRVLSYRRRCMAQSRMTL